MPAARTTFEVAEETLERAGSEAQALLRETRTTQVDATRQRWLYEDNPDGRARLWTVRNSDTGELAGFTVCLPRQMRVDGQPRVAWNGADFSMRSSYRSLGPAVKLRRAARTAIDQGQADFLYAHPNARMALIHQRVGHRVVGQMQRLALPLRAEPYLRERIGPGWLRRPVAAAIELSWRMANRAARTGRRGNVRLEEHATFDERFDELFERTCGQYRIVGARTAGYLNWRYARNPLYESHSLVLGQGSRISGYLIFTVRDGVAHVKDLYAPGPAGTAAPLLAALIRHGRRCGWLSISSVLLDRCPLVDDLQRFGFRRREGASEMVAYAHPGSPINDFLYDPQAWFLTVGDRDV